MFLAFVPLLIGLTVLSGMVGLPAETTRMETWQLGVVFAGLPALGFLLGHVGGDALGSRSAATLNPRRVVGLGIWFLVALAVELPQHLVAWLQATGGAGEAGSQQLGLVLLMLNVWVSDALALRQVRFDSGEALAKSLWGLWGVLRLGLPVLILGLLGTVAVEGLGQRWSGPWAAVWLTGGYMALFLVAMPLLVRWSWGLRPLSPEHTRVIRDELAACGVGATPALAWPEESMGQSTAGVFGFLPGMRFLLVGPSIARLLTEQELRAVVAHEAAHVRFGHLWYFMAALLGFGLSWEVFNDYLSWSLVTQGTNLPDWLMGLVDILVLLLFLRVVGGWMSRHFERQADLYSVARHGEDPFRTALLKVAILNGMPLKGNNWHHYGLPHRMAFAQFAQNHPQRANLHHRLVRGVKFVVLLGLGLGLGLKLLQSQGILMPPALDDPEAITRLESHTRPAGGDEKLAEYLAALALGRHDAVASVRMFRLLVRWYPDDPGHQNNLAWALATSPNAGEPQLDEALGLAERAFATKPAAFIADTVAEVRLRLGLAEPAMEASHEALSLALGGQGLGGASLTYYQQRVLEVTRQARRLDPDLPLANPSPQPSPNRNPNRSTPEDALPQFEHKRPQLI